MTNWKEIHPNFTPELQKEWENKGFTQEQVQHWFQTFGNNFNPNDYNFFDWLVNGNQTEVIRLNQTQVKKSKINWQKKYGNPFLDFTEETTQHWIRADFTHMQTREWLSTGLQATDANCAWWLRDIEKKTPESILNHDNDEVLRKQYREYLQTLRNSSGNEGKDEDTLLIEAITSSLESEENDRWQRIHPEFTLELRREWENKWFTYEEVKEWVSKGGDIYDVEFAALLKDKKSQNRSVWDLTEIKSVKNQNAQKWLNKNFPKERRTNLIELDISGKNLEGSLRIEDFANLEKLNCSENKITRLEIINCPNLKEIECFANDLVNLKIINCSQLEKLDCKWNELTSPNFVFSLNPNKLTWLDIRDNAISPSDLSCFSKFTNLEFLSIGALCPITIDRGIFNLFYGSLEPLKNMSKLEYLLIDNTDINSGVEHLPNSLSGIQDGYKKISYSTEARPESKVREIERQLDLFTSGLQNNGFDLVKDDEPKIRKINKKEIIQQRTMFQETIDRLEKEGSILQKQLEKATKFSNLQAVKQIEEKLEIKRKEIKEFEERLEKVNEQLSEVIDSESEFSNQVEVTPKN